MNDYQIIVISPSGNFYGSEQVLFDYLNHTKLNLVVFVPIGILYDKLVRIKRHRIIKINKNIISFYLIILYRLFFDNKIKSVYSNEAAHSRYIVALAKLFPKCSFYIHIRINEDSNPIRWPKILPSNIKIFAISNYIQSQFIHRSIFLYDPFTYKVAKSPFGLMAKKFRIGIIGRISFGKGFIQINNFIKYLNNDHKEVYEIKFYGEADNDVELNLLIKELLVFNNISMMGFCDGKDKMYNSIDCVMHFCASEPLGRIYLEAINYGKPLIGFKSGGIGEIGKLLQLDDILINFEKSYLENSVKFMEVLEKVKSNYQNYSLNSLSKVEKAKEIFSIDRYVEILDKELNF